MNYHVSIESPYKEHVHQILKISFAGLVSLGDCYKRSGKLRDSASVLEEAVEIRHSTYSSPHPDLASGANSLYYCKQMSCSCPKLFAYLAIQHLAEVYFLLEDPEKPLQLALALFKKSQSHLPSTHPDLAVCKPICFAVLSNITANCNDFLQI